jgi:hypothetical protein
LAVAMAGTPAARGADETGGRNLSAPAGSAGFEDGAEQTGSSGSTSEVLVGAAYGIATSALSSVRRSIASTCACGFFCDLTGNCISSPILDFLGV